MILVHRRVIAQAALHRPPCAAVLDAITQVMQQAAVVRLGNDLDPHDAVRRLEHGPQLRGQFEVIGGPFEELVSGFEHGALLGSTAGNWWLPGGTANANKNPGRIPYVRADY